MAAACGLQSIRDVLLVSYFEDAIDDVEFTVLYEENYSREIFPYWKYDKFDLDGWDDAECKVELRFDKSDLPVLLRTLRFPDRFVCSQRTVCSGMEGLCILLKRLSFPCRYSDMALRFGRNPTELCLIFNHVLDFVYRTHQHRLNSWNQPFLNPRALEHYAQSIHSRGAPLENCFGFVDGSLCKIARPKNNQREVYNGHKRVHALKFQSVVLPNGLIANLNGPYEGRRHDATMLNESGLLRDLQAVAWANDGTPLCLYGDPAYPLGIHLQAPFRNVHITPQMARFNERMSEVRVAVEWMFGCVSNYYKFIEFQKQLQIGLSPVGKLYLVCGILQNAHTCLYGNIVSDYFGVDPPNLVTYFW